MNKLKPCIMLLLGLTLVGCSTPLYHTSSLDVSLPDNRHRHISAKLGDGTFAVLAGWEAQKTNNVYLVSAALTHVEPLGVKTDWRGRDVSGASLPNGNVLLVDGGYESVFDYRTKQTLPTKNALSPDYIRWATLTLLRSGRVLVSGGFTADFKPLSSWALYDPQQNSFTESGEMTTARARHTATELADGRILIAGGCGSDYSDRSFNSAEMLDLTTKRSVRLESPMRCCRSGHGAALLDNGGVLLVGGYSPKSEPTSVRTCEIFDPRSLQFHDTASLGRGRTAPLLWKCGRDVLVIGGDKNSRVVEIFDEPQNQFFINPELLHNPRGSEFTVTPFSDNAVVVIGGRVDDSGRSLSSLETITARRPFAFHSWRQVLARTSDQQGDLDAVVSIYEGPRLHAQFPVFGFAVTSRELWPHLRNHPVSLQFQEHLQGCHTPSLSVSFTPACDYVKRVTLLHILGVSEIPSISVASDLTQGVIRQWNTAEQGKRSVRDGARR